MFTKLMVPLEIVWLLSCGNKRFQLFIHVPVLKKGLMIVWSEHQEVLLMQVVMSGEGR